MTRRICWLNEKGGSGKSTSAINMAAILASEFSRKVLIVDADPQGNTTSVFAPNQDPTPTLSNVLQETATAADAVLSTNYENLHLLPASVDLADVNVLFADSASGLSIGREKRLKRSLRSIDAEYDYVVVDTGPDRSLLNINVLNYVDEVFVPIDPGFFSLTGITRLNTLVDQVRELMEHPTLHIAGVLITQVEHNNVGKDVEQQVRAHFGDLVFKASIPKNTKVNEAHTRGLSVLDYAPSSTGAVAYLALTQEVINHEHHTTEQDGSGHVPVAADEQHTRTAA